jgi:hypothetical protein
MKAVKIVGAAFLILVGVALFLRAIHPKPADEIALPPSGLGQVLAEEAAKALNDKGTVVLAWMPTGAVESQAKFDGFQRAIARHKGIAISAIKEFKREEVSFGRISFEQFAGVVREHAKAGVIVSFLGVNSFTEAQIATLPQPSPKLVVVGWNPQDVQRGIKAGIVTAAVMARQLQGLPTDDPKSPIQWFDRYYNLVTPETIAPPQ